MQMIAEDLIDMVNQRLVLLGGRAVQSGKLIFPFPKGAEAARYDKVALKSEGTLWAFTVQRFPPKNPPFIGENEPSNFKPYAVGYVELEGELIVESRLAVEDFEDLKIGQMMRLTAVPFATDANGASIFTYAFEPV
ncbi:MAG: OB-fold domain-containing protein [Pseudomonadota bacterium]